MLMYARVECLKTTFVIDLTSKVILGNPFMALIYPFQTSEEGIQIYCTPNKRNESVKRNVKFLKK